MTLRVVPHADQETTEIVSESVQRRDRVPDIRVDVRVAVADVIRDGVDHEHADAAQISGKRLQRVDVIRKSNALLDAEATLDERTGGDEPRLEVDLGRVLARGRRRSLPAW